MHGHVQTMLHGMPQSADAAVPAPHASFSGVLAAFSSLASQPSPTSKSDQLDDDVVTLSYERALRTHSRHRPSESMDWSLPAVAAEKSSLPQPALRGDAVESQSRPEDLKSASITLRMTQAECNQLRARAAEARMTVSAYLRSCAFEVEALRAQVKEALVQLRQASVQQTPGPGNRPWWRPWQHGPRRTRQN